MLRNLEAIGAIRNRFDHTHLSLDFADPDVQALCDNLTFPRAHAVISSQSDDPFSRIQGPRNRF